MFVGATFAVTKGWLDLPFERSLCSEFGVLGIGVVVVFQCVSVRFVLIYCFDVCCVL